MVRPNADMKPVYIVTLPRDIETERVRITRKQKKTVTQSRDCVKAVRWEAKQLDWKDLWKRWVLRMYDSSAVFDLPGGSSYPHWFTTTFLLVAKKFGLHGGRYRYNRNILFCSFHVGVGLPLAQVAHCAHLLAIMP